MAEPEQAKGWEAHAAEQRRAWLALSYAERLRWLEDAKRFYRRGASLPSDAMDDSG
jgi:hypothetical protein